jgi:hypothetical protein
MLIFDTYVASFRMLYLFILSDQHHWHSLYDDGHFLVGEFILNCSSAVPNESSLVFCVMNVGVACGINFGRSLK